MSSNKNKKNAEKIDEIANAIEQSMKKGHISTLILLALEKEPSHGYNLMQLIHDGTYGVWTPTASSLYPHLSSLTEKGLIEFTTEMDGKRERKVYSITQKGRDTLKTLVDRQRNMRNSLMAMVMSTIGLTDSVIPESIINDFEDVFGPEILEETLMNKDNKEKLKILSKRKIVLKSVIGKLNNVIDEINERVKEIKASEK